MRAGERVGYYDIETADWSTYVVGATLEPDRSTPRFYWHDPAALLDGMTEAARRRGVRTWRAHNAGRFDALLLLSLAAARGLHIRCMMRGASVLRAAVYLSASEGDVLHLEDTAALAPTSLRAFAAAAGGEQKGEVDYSRITARLAPSSAFGRQLADYLACDVRALRDADTAWRAVLAEVAGVQPALTLGGTAWASVVAQLGGEGSRAARGARLALSTGENLLEPTSAAEYADSRAGYYGGRVEVFLRRAASGHRYDRNSSYPAALVNVRVPTGQRRWRRTWNGEEGTVWATVHVPEMHAPPLPARVGGRVVFPTGTFSGAWTAYELRTALARGVGLVSVQRARIATETTDCLASWCSRVWAERVSRPAWSKLLKLLANSLTGKLAQQPTRDELRYIAGGDVPSGARLLTPVDARGARWVAVESTRVGACARPEWSAYLTAEARGELLAQLDHAGGGAAYCDTDSVYSTRELTRALGDGLGAWKYEGAMFDWHALAPKVYSYVDGSGRRRARGKGLPGLDGEGFDRVARGEPHVSDRGVVTLRTSLRGGELLFERQILTRRVKRPWVWCGGRLNARGDATRAPTWEEASRRFGR